jgi:hypothetical protein
MFGYVGGLDAGYDVAAAFHPFAMDPIGLEPHGRACGPAVN